MRFPFSALTKISSSLILRRSSLIYHSQSYQQYSYSRYNQHSYRGHRVYSHSECSNVNLSNMSFSPSRYRDQGVHRDSQSGFLDHLPGVGTYRKEEQFFLGKEEENSSDTYGSQALNISTSSASSTSNSKSETFMSPYGDYDMDDSSFFAHTTRLNIIGPNPNSTQFFKRRSSSAEKLLINYGERSMATATSSLRKADRSRPPSPPVPLVPIRKPISPSVPYLQLSLQSLPPLADPTTSRKLLVLDLNGTLLIRSPHSGHRGVRRPGGYPPSRAIYLRPYLPSFRAYIFHPTTLQWLDTMVWSSAQPHSVNDMADKCFGTYKDVFKAIWARDSLGLSSNQYREYICCVFYNEV